MKYFPLIWATLWRKKTRTLFTLLSIVIAFLLFGMLETVDYAFSHPSAGASAADKLITTNKYSITLPLPFADLQEIRSVPGVADVTWITWFGGYYQEPKNFVFALPIDTESYFDVHKDEFVVSDEDMKNYRNMRSAALVNVALMKKFGWKVGDKIPIHSTIWTQKSSGSLDWTFDIVGIVRCEGFHAGQRAGLHGVVSLRSVRRGTQLRQRHRGLGRGADRRPRRNGAAIAGKIDALFANSPNETKTQPANDFAMAFIKQFGDIGFVLRAILGAVFFTLLFLTGNTMMQSVRERIPELAVLKTMGFTDGKVLALVIAESLLLCLLRRRHRPRVELWRAADHWAGPAGRGA